jgi:hypothetical protein
MATYNPLLVIVTWNGVPIVGFQDGSMVEVEYNQDAFSLHVGTQGDYLRVMSCDHSGKLTVHLMQSSPTNDALSTFANLDRTLGSVVGPFTITDLNGTTTVISPQTWIMKMPKVEFGKEATGRDWVFESGNIVENVGGELLSLPVSALPGL